MDGRKRYGEIPIQRDCWKMREVPLIFNLKNIDQSF
jgi:hypothetical protein